MCFASKSDIIYRRLILSSFFSKGWGNVKVYERLLEARKVVSDRTKVNALIPSDYPVELTKSWTKDACYIAEGHFVSPLAEFFPGLLPKESENAHFQIIVPKKWPKKGRKPLCLHLAGTGDHYFWRRRNLMAKPLVKEHGIASILLENPFYGLRKPNKQVRSSLRHVADLFVMGAALILESHVLLHWGRRQGYAPLGITGISMGGHMASLACTAWPEPLAIVPCLSWSTASSVFTQVDKSWELSLRPITLSLPDVTGDQSGKLKVALWIFLRFYRRIFICYGCFKTWWQPWKFIVYYVAKAMVIFSHVKIACYFHVRRYHVQLCKCNYYYTLGSSLRKPPTFGDATTGFPTKWRLRNKHTNSIMMTHLYLDLGSGTSSVWNFCTRFSDIIWRGNLSGKVANCQLFSQATVEAMAKELVVTGAKFLV